MLVGAFGPWAKVLVFTIDGTDDGRDGWILVGAAGVAAVFLLFYLYFRRRWLAVFPFLAGCAGAAAAGYDISDINNLASGSEFAGSEFGSALGSALVSTEWGIYVALVGSISLILASVALVLETRHPTSSLAVPPAPPPPAP